MELGSITTSTDSEQLTQCMDLMQTVKANIFSQFGDNNVQCCPNCQSKAIVFRATFGAFYCTKCHTHFKEPGKLETRIRKSCPACGSVSLTRKLKTKGYECKQCGNICIVPIKKEVAVKKHHSGKKPVSLIRRGEN